MWECVCVCVVNDGCKGGGGLGLVFNLGRIISSVPPGLRVFRPLYTIHPLRRRPAQVDQSPNMRHFQLVMRESFILWMADFSSWDCARQGRPFPWVKPIVWPHTSWLQFRHLAEAQSPNWKLPIQSDPQQTISNTNTLTVKVFFPPPN